MTINSRHTTRDIIAMFADLNVTRLRDSSGWQKVICPICSRGRNKSTEACLGVNVTTGRFGCWHCGWTGSVLYKKEYKPNYSPIDSTRQKELPQSAKDWLINDRGLTEEVLARNNLRVETRMDKATGLKRKYVVFNYYLGSNIVNAKYRTKDKLFQSAKSGAPVFYKMNDTFEQNTVIITEGEIDALSYEVAGYKYAISIPNGGTVPKLNSDKVQEYKYIEECLPYLQDVDRFLLSTDNDIVGRYLQREFIRRFGRQKCYKITYPPDCKDANEVLVKYGKEAVQNMVASATLFPTSDVFTLKSRKKEFEDLWEYGYENGVMTGIQEFDTKLKFFTGMFHVVSGIPQHGKSTWVDYMTVLLAINNGWKTAYYTPENKDLELHGQRIASQLIGKPFVPQFNGRMSKEEMQAAYAFIDEYYRYVYPDQIVSLDEILEAFDYNVQKSGVKLCVIDPWNTIQHNIPKFEQETNHIAKCLNKMKYFAREKDVHFILVAHPVKQDKNAAGVFDVPSLYSIAGSANFFNIPDYGTIIYQPANGTMRVMHDKIKHKGFMGAGGTGEYQFDLGTQRLWVKGQDRFQNLLKTVAMDDVAEGVNNLEQAPF